MHTRRTHYTTCLCIILFVLAGGARCTAFGEDFPPAAPRRFTATAEYSTPGAGTRTIQIGIIIDHVIRPQEAEGFKKSLTQGGQRALKSAIRNRSDGRLIVGAVEYPLNIIAANPSGGGFRYAVVTVRPIKIHERDTGQPSLEYPFAVLVFEVDEDGRGEGELYKTAALRVDAGGQVEVEDFNGGSGRLRDIEPQDSDSRWGR